MFSLLITIPAIIYPNQRISISWKLYSSLSLQFFLSSYGYVYLGIISYHELILYLDWKCRLWQVWLQQQERDVQLHSISSIRGNL